MRKIRGFIIAFLLVFFISLPAQATESIPNSQNISDNKVMPRTLITTTVKKWSDTNNFSVTAGIVTNDGTGKIIDIKNIKQGAFLSDATDIHLSGGKIWNACQKEK